MQEYRRRLIALLKLQILIALQDLLVEKLLALERRG